MKHKNDKGIKKNIKSKLLEETMSYLNVLLILVCFILSVFLIAKIIADSIQVPLENQQQI